MTRRHTKMSKGPNSDFLLNCTRLLFLGALTTRPLNLEGRHLNIDIAWVGLTDVKKGFAKIYLTILEPSI